MAVTPEQLAAAGTEHAHQAAYFAALQRAIGRYGSLSYQLQWAHAIPNGGERDVIVAGRMKAEGVKAGVWDVFIPVPCGKWHGMYIEFKKPKRRREEDGGVSDKQREFGIAMHRLDYYTCVAYTWEEAFNATVAYIEGRV